MCDIELNDIEDIISEYDLPQRRTAKTVVMPKVRRKKDVKIREDVLDPVFSQNTMPGIAFGFVMIPVYIAFKKSNL